LLAVNAPPRAPAHRIQSEKIQFASIAEGKLRELARVAQCDRENVGALALEAPIVFFENGIQPR
jgi:hypothetical protein